ncbi:AbiA family abortive infection protein [Lactobacillus sp. ESL0785]|uniref:AbiA family abortive infection protein n=1 Tax=Lactobacillus sp. ESL0785 TaxID=2983232 RepID=UPI0023F991F5|nr:AbiA family abortive infection protein [Lactobacillus sp. ESL0785]WEV71301.1 AbiA family abortive infection protein [Lactobacillus sp. ESL0785]
MEELWDLTYEDWNAAVTGFFSILNSQLDKHLQTYPFIRFTNKQREYIESEKFFDQYIKNGIVIGKDMYLKVIDNFIQKGNGSLRSIELVTPLIYLLLIVIGYHLSRNIKINKYSEAYYVGDFENNIYYYKIPYKKYTDKLKKYSKKYKYYCKTDLSNFFPSIDVGLLFKRIRNLCPNESERSLLIYRNLIEYIGNGKFPIVDGNVGLSYIATICYLYNFDKLLYELLGKSNIIKKYKIVRYVDDAYIFFDCDDDLYKDCKLEILIKFQDAVKDSRITENVAKRKFDKCENIKFDLYNDSCNIYAFEYEDLDEDKYCDLDTLINLLKNLNKLEGTCSFNEVKDTIECSLKKEKIDYNSNELINKYIYDKQDYFKESKVKELLFNIANHKKYIFIYYSRQFMQMILNTNDTNYIKKFLNEIFKNSRSTYFSQYNLLMAIQYLLARNFCHSSLLNLIKDENPKIFNYIKLYCKQSKYYHYTEEDFRQLFVIGNNKLYSDFKQNFLYLMYKSNANKSMVLEKFAYYKNYFDRKLTNTLNLFRCFKKPIAYNATYTVKQATKYFKKLYNKKYISQSENEEFQSIVEQACKLRNHNPIDHASSEILSNDNVRNTEIQESIYELNKILIILEKRID